jgi:hypothetical protein
MGELSEGVNSDLCEVRLVEASWQAVARVPIRCDGIQENSWHEIYHTPKDFELIQRDVTTIKEAMVVTISTSAPNKEEEAEN